VARPFDGSSVFLIDSIEDTTDEEALPQMVTTTFPRVLERIGYSALNGEGISMKSPRISTDGAMPTIW
jgi:hypothetical protein